MSCNYHAQTTEAVALSVGAGHIEATWSDHRNHPQNCKQCGAFLRADGGCIACERGLSYSVRSDGETLAMAAGSSPRMCLSCGHTMDTTVSPGSEEWCTACDDFATVGEPYVDPSGTLLIAPPDKWGPGRVQLWGVLEQEARRLGITNVVRQWTGFAHSPASSKAKGKVDGFFYGHDDDGQWYFVAAYGPVGIAGVRKTRRCKEGEVESEAFFYGRHGAKNGDFSASWPDDGDGKGIGTCPACGALFAAGSVCYNCDPQAARADAERSIEGGWM